MSDNPFGGMFGDIFSMLGQQGPDAWFTTATQLALNIARGEDNDPNPLPIERQRLEELAPLVARHVDSLLGVSIDASVVAVNRSALTLAALTQWRPLMEPMVSNTATISCSTFCRPSDTRPDPLLQLRLELTRGDRHIGWTRQPGFVGIKDPLESSNDRRTIDPRDP